MGTPGPSDHRLRGVTLPLRTKGQVLKMALDALQSHLQEGDLLQGKEVWMAISLLPLGGFTCVGRAARPLFARPDAMLFQMLHLEAHCRAVDAAPGTAGSGAVGFVPIGLPPPGKTRAAAPAALSALAAPAGAARPAWGRRRGHGAHGTTPAGGLVCTTPGPALCRLRAAGRRALLLAG